MLPTDVAFAEAAGALGLRRDLITVVYDGHGIFSAPRVWWTLRTMGFPEVFVLDGGLKDWIAQGRPISSLTRRTRRRRQSSRPSIPASYATYRASARRFPRATPR